MAKKKEEISPEIYVKEFDDKAFEIVRKIDEETPFGEVIEASKLMYELKKKYFHWMGWDNVYENMFHSSGFCPFCLSIEINDHGCHDCPLGEDVDSEDLACCSEWNDFDSAICEYRYRCGKEGNSKLRNKCDKTFNALKKRIDAVPDDWEKPKDESD